MIIFSVAALIICRFVVSLHSRCRSELTSPSLSSVTLLRSHRKSSVAVASLGGRLANTVRTALSLLISCHECKTHLSKHYIYMSPSPPLSPVGKYELSTIIFLTELEFSLFPSKKKTPPPLLPPPHPLLLVVIFLSLIHEYYQHRSEPCSPRHCLLMMLI